MMPRVVKVSPLPKYRLHVEFDDGVAGTIDLSGELDGEVFRPLRDEAVFRQVTVDEFGAVSWPDGLDLAPDAMYNELTGEPPRSRPQHRTAKTTWFEFAEKLIQTAYFIFGEGEVPITEKGAADPKVLAKTLLARTLSHFKSIIMMIREGMTVEARILTRCCFENLLWIGSLQANGDEFVKAMFHDEARSSQVRGEFILREAYKLDDKVERRLRGQLRNISKRSPKSKSLSAKDVAEDSVLRHAYLIYSQLSADAGHPTFSSLNRYICRFEEDGATVRGIDIAPPPKEDDLIQTLDWACSAMIGVCVGANQILEGTPTGQRLLAIADEYQALAGRASVP